jgi:hypothetical protein
MKVKLHDGTVVTCEPEALGPGGAGRELVLGPEGLTLELPGEEADGGDGADGASRRGAWPAALLGAQLTELMARAFDPGRPAAARPTVGEWAAAISHLADRVVTCGDEECGGLFPLSDGAVPVCPWCSSPLVLRDHTPVLHMYQEGEEASYQAAPHAWIAGTEGRKLYAWHTSSAATAATAEEKRMIAEVEYRDGIWSLRNHALGELRVIRNGRTERVVPIGDAVTLHDGLTLLLGPPPAGRALVVSRFEL